MTIAYKCKNAINIGTIATVVYTVPVGTTAVVTSFIVANRSGVDATVDITVTHSAVVSYLVRQAPLPANGAIIPLGDGNKQPLEAGDLITVTASAATTADATLGVMEES